MPTIAISPDIRAAKRSSPDEGLSAIRAALQGLQFGTLTITVQDAVIVQLERTERRRLRHGSANRGAAEK
ncbi:MAG TPA: YezD family protein [Pirellulales bacterium]|jgi:hypothetical protein|nr:YezD family protein [Pirellulales bacterium]